MHKDLLKLFGELILNIAIIVGVIYIVGILVRFGIVDMKRAIIPQFVNDILWYRLRLGGFNLVDYTKLGAFAFLLYFPVVIYANLLTKMFFPPSIVAVRADVAITKIVNEKGTRVEESDIRCFQVSPNCISIRHSARATVGWKFYKEWEDQIETAVGVDFTKFVFMQGSEVRAYFQYGAHHKIADILIEAQDGRLLVIKGNGGKYVYVLGSNIDPDKCEDFKIGFVDALENIETRMKAAATFDSRFKHLLVAIPVYRQQDETAIHDKLDDYRLYDADEPGREIFVNAPPVLATVKGWINEMQDRHGT